MFYAQFVLAKKGPLSKIWLAAHWERKLSKAQIFETDVQDAVEEILRPKQKMSLRTTGHLLLGIVRIYSKKAKYVLADCNEAFIKIKMAFRPGTGELHVIADSRRDRSGSENDQILDDLDTIMPDLTDYDFAPGPLQHTQGRIDDITLQEDNFDTRSMRDANFDTMDDFGDMESNFDEEFERTRRNFEMLQQNSRGSDMEIERRSVSYMEDGESFGNSLPHSDHLNDDFGMDVNDDEFQDLENLLNANMETDENHISESIILEPLDNQSPDRQTRQKRRRKLIIDDNTTISGEEMKMNMTEFGDTLQPLDLAPPTKRLMKLKETGLAERIFNLPATDIFVNESFLKFYQSHLIPNAKADKIINAEDIRRDLDMVENIEDYDENDDPNQLGQPEFVFDPMLDDEYSGMGTEDNNELNHEENGTEHEKENRKGRKKGQDRQQEEAESEEESEQEEEEKLGKKTLNVLHTIASKLRISDNEILLEDLLTKGSTHKSAAQKFYALLELHKSQAIRVDQNEAFGPISIQQGPQFEEISGQQ
ncbi:hypothetical protein M3Y97_00335700 [Aphelenchoides bicaudatus]|nr:hypothetical protein M3Y97_00335700 [Aphelenchoides bicaudatus]